MCSFGDARAGLPHYQVPATVGGYFHENKGRYFLQSILPLKGINLDYGCIYLKNVPKKDDSDTSWRGWIYCRNSKFVTHIFCAPTGKRRRAGQIKLHTWRVGRRLSTKLKNNWNWGEKERTRGKYVWDVLFNVCFKGWLQLTICYILHKCCLFNSRKQSTFFPRRKFSMYKCNKALNKTVKECMWVLCVSCYNARLKILEEK